MEITENVIEKEKKESFSIPLAVVVVEIHLGTPEESCSNHKVSNDIVFGGGNVSPGLQFPPKTIQKSYRSGSEIRTRLRSQTIDQVNLSSIGKVPPLFFLRFHLHPL